VHGRTVLVTRRRRGLNIGSLTPAAKKSNTSSIGRSMTVQPLKE
jgi:hypothetical protein